VDVGQLGRQPVADDGELLTSGSHGVASPSAVNRAAGKPHEQIPRCVVQTNRRTNWPIAHLYSTVTGARRTCRIRPCRETRSWGLFRRGRISSLLYVIRTAVSDPGTGRAVKFWRRFSRPERL